MNKQGLLDDRELKQLLDGMQGECRVNKQELLELHKLKYDRGLKQLLDGMQGEREMNEISDVAYWMDRISALEAETHALFARNINLIAENNTLEAQLADAQAQMVIRDTFIERLIEVGCRLAGSKMVSGRWDSLLVEYHATVAKNEKVGGVE